MSDIVVWSRERLDKKLWQYKERYGLILEESTTERQTLEELQRVVKSLHKNRHKKLGNRKQESDRIRRLYKIERLDFQAWLNGVAQVIPTAVDQKLWEELNERYDKERYDPFVSRAITEAQS